MKRFWLVMLMMWCAAQAASAHNVQIVTSVKGVTAWLVHEPSVPVVALHFTFEGSGGLQDETGKEGQSVLMASLLDEGAGPYTSEAFQDRMRNLAFTLNFTADNDDLGGALVTLSANKTAAFQLLKTALREPRFETEALERMRVQILSLIQNAEKDPAVIAALTFNAAAYAKHRYALPPNGTAKTVARLTREDVRAAFQRGVARSRLRVTAVGDITVDELKAVLDDVFGDLPSGAPLPSLPAATFRGASQPFVTAHSGTQSHLLFGRPGIKRQDPDFIPAFLLKHMVGGVLLTSRLNTEIRVKRGLTYGIYAALNNDKAADLWAVDGVTKNEAAGEVNRLVASILKDVVTNGVSAEELVNAKSYLIGSYVLNFDTSAKLAGFLMGLRLAGLTPDYIDQRDALIGAVTRDDIQRVARRLFTGEELTVIVGQPQGLEQNGR